MSNKQGSILIYAIILVNMVVFLALLIFSRSEILLKNANFQEYNAKLSKNIDEKMGLATDFDTFLNSDGGGFVDTRTCPTSISYNGGSFTDSTSLHFNQTTSQLSCTGMNTVITFSSDFSTFDTLNYSGQIAPVSNDATTASGTLPDSTSFTFPLGGMSGIDSNFNSDNYTAYSTGNIAYPDGNLSDDTLARETFYGYVRRNAGWNSAFWNNDETLAFIKANTHNQNPTDSGSADIFHVYSSGATDARLFLDIDQPALLRIVEFSSGIYDQSKELHKLSDRTYKFDLSGFGYVQSGSGTPDYTTITGSVLQTSTLSGAINSSFGLQPLTFDLKNKNYGIFLSFSGADSQVADFLSYKLRFTTATGSGVYIVPLDDSRPDFFYYLGNDIIIGEDGNFYPKQIKLSKAR